MGLLGTALGALGGLLTANELFSPGEQIAQVSPAPGVQVGTIE